jgi:aryl-alcohol dehydrogenase
MRVSAAVMRGKSGRFEIEQLTLDDLREGEVLVRIAGVGICHTDLSVRDQIFPFRLPAVLGHEGAGIVERVGANVATIQVGDHVVLSFGSCGQCSNCQEKNPAYCTKAALFNLTGVRASDGKSVYRDARGANVYGSFFGQSSFGEYALVNERNAVKIARDVPIELMGPLGCGIQTGAGTVMNVLKPRYGSSIAIFGAGSVGLAAVMAARVAGCTTIIAVDVNDARLALAQTLGATHIINGGREDTVKAIKEIVRHGVQGSIECTGNSSVLRQAVDCLQAKGACALVGVAGMRAEVALNMNFMLNGRTLRGVMEGDSDPQVFIPYLIDLWRQNRFPFDKLVRFYDLTNINQAVEDAEQGRVIKPILRPVLQPSH